MSYFLTGLLSAMIGGSFAALSMAALQINRREIRDEDRSGAPEGAQRLPEVR
jgi:hypothetical protein